MSKSNMMILGLIVSLALYPLGVDSAWLAIGTTFLVFSTVALSQDIVLGRAGVFHMGHAMFFGLGAYTTAILNVHFGWEIAWTFLPAIGIAVISAFVLMAPIIHLRGDYLLVATIGFNIIFIQVLTNDLFGLTGGPNGIFGIDVVRLFGVELSSQSHVYYMALALLCITLFIIKTLDKSKFGRALFYMHKDEIAAQSMGISLRYFKLYAFLLGAGIAGAAGSMFSIQYSAVSPEAFNVTQSIMFFTIVLVGGSASLPGVLIGTFVMFVLPEMFRDFQSARYLVFGIAMILTMILRPHGIWPVKFGNIPSFLKKGAK